MAADRMEKNKTHASQLFSCSDVRPCTSNRFCKVWVKAGVVQCEFIPSMAPAACDTPPSLQSGVFYPNIKALVVAGLKTYKELDKDLDGQRRRLKQKGRRTAPSQVTPSPAFAFLPVCFKFALSNFLLLPNLFL